MKKLLKFLLTLTLVLTAFSCTSLRDIARREEAAKYNDIRATFITTQGDITFYLYPEAAPITVANFITITILKYIELLKTLLFKGEILQELVQEDLDTLFQMNL